MAEVPIAVPASIRDEVVPSRKRVKLPPWLEIAKPRLIPLLLATTLGGMALSESWPLPLPRLACTLGGGALAAAAAGVLNCLWEEQLDGQMQRTSGRALLGGEPPGDLAAGHEQGADAGAVGTRGGERLGMLAVLDPEIEGDHKKALLDAKNNGSAKFTKAVDGCLTYYKTSSGE